MANIDTQCPYNVDIVVDRLLHTLSRNYYSFYYFLLTKTLIEINCWNFLQFLACKGYKKAGVTSDANGNVI